MIWFIYVFNNIRFEVPLKNQRLLIFKTPVEWVRFYRDRNSFTLMGCWWGRRERNLSRKSWPSFARSETKAKGGGVRVATTASSRRGTTDCLLTRKHWVESGAERPPDGQLSLLFTCRTSSRLPRDLHAPPGEFQWHLEFSSLSFRGRIHSCKYRDARTGWRLGRAKSVGQGDTQHLQAGRCEASGMDTATAS
jgi:hypothetical protein